MASPVVLLHGFTHTGASWGKVMGALPPGYRALAPDLRGHGAAAQREPVTLEGVLEDLDAVAPYGCVLCGYSMGGRLALHAALDPRLERRLQRLVLIGASPGLADPAHRAARRAEDQRVADGIEAMGVERFSRAWAQRTPVLGGQPAEVRDSVHRDRLRNTAAGLRRALEGLGTGALPSLWERLGELDMPVTLVVGERDLKFREIAVRMAERIPDAELVVVAGAGHAVHVEAPLRVAELLR